MSQQNPLVSIVIPNYNHDQYLGDAINSVLNQTYPSCELIVVDDGSVDNSRELIRKFGSKVKAIFQNNRGLSAARNVGLSIAIGDFIGVLDADDMYESQYVDTLVSLLQQQPDAGGIYCGYRFVDHTNHPLPQIEARAFNPEKMNEALFEGNFLVPEAVFLRRKVYDVEGRFDETLQACEDWDMWLRVTKKNRIISSNQILTRHRILPGSMSTNPQRMLTNRLAVLQRHMGEKPVYSGSSRVHRAYGRAFLASCVEYLQHGNNDFAYEMFQKMAHVCPDLLLEVDTYYQLGCGNQPKGFMGDLKSLNIKKSSLQLLTMMTCFFSNRQAQAEVKDLKEMAFAQAYYVLGLLGYGTRDFRESRRFFARAAARNPRLVLNKQFAGPWLKSLVNPRIIDGLRGLRWRFKRTYGSPDTLE